MENNNNFSGLKKLTILLIIIGLAIIGLEVYTLMTSKEKDCNCPVCEKKEVTSTDQSSNNNSQRKLVEVKCQNFVETYGDIKVEVKNAHKDAVDECAAELLINEMPIVVGDSNINSIEIYDSYVIAYHDGVSISMIDTRDTNYKTYDGVKVHNTTIYTAIELKGYDPKSYTSDDEGILIIGQNSAEQSNVSDPGSKYAKIRIKYSNNKFLSPEIVEKYN